VHLAAVAQFEVPTTPLAPLQHWGPTVRCRFVVGMALFGFSGRATAMAAIRRQNPGNPLARFDGIYDLYRNCILNELYYGHRLNWFTRAGLTLEIIIVIGSGASGVAGWIIWTKFPAAAAIWGAIAAAATLLAALKPILQMDAKIKHYSSRFSACRQLALSMKVVVDEIAEATGIPGDIEREIDRIRKRYRNLAIEDDPRPPPKLVKRLQEEVNRRVPPSSLWYPAAGRDPALIGHVLARATPSIAGDAEGIDTKIDPTDRWPSGKRESQ
jgi:hypothetical protein